ncbi:hypothetical protein predicted by Glimmer/Critica [Sorangium cellulosum So ce56]|uniref:Uncharacterized protein n=1 Tax=Sorangium cellulosum (strain So ce56) TaxID=448385 RepID=A9GC85_SORC5|nr:hypothetical protein [Sorangium cellulosum]CAN96154.1 hypothetical protein predicted by Glimmer/Critica [Sorangium cellulosum So ce56]
MAGSRRGRGGAVEGAGRREGSAGAGGPTHQLQKEAAATSNLATYVRAIQSAVVNHATKVAGMVDEDEPETVESVRKALRPLDAHREAGARRGQGGAKGEATNSAPAAPPATETGADGGALG